MARRNRRRPRVVWLPQDPFFSIDAATLASQTVMRASDSLLSPTIGAHVEIIAPVVRDVSPNPLTTANTLSDIEQSGYRLRRIVGKFWCFCAQTAPDNGGPGAAVVTAGFIVLKTAAQTAVPLQVAAEYAPNDIINTADPWIWRRSWLVVNNGSANSVPFGDNNIGSLGITSHYSNVSLGGNADGAHIDQKTARIVGPDERLFLIIGATQLTAADGQTAMNLDYVWDLRVLGSMRSNVGNRGNSSR